MPLQCPFPLYDNAFMMTKWHGKASSFTDPLKKIHLSPAYSPHKEPAMRSWHGFTHTHNIHNRHPIARPMGQGMVAFGEFNVLCSGYVIVKLYAILCYIRPRYMESRQHISIFFIVCITRPGQTYDCFCFTASKPILTDMGYVNRYLASTRHKNHEPYA